MAFAGSDNNASSGTVAITGVAALPANSATALRLTRLSPSGLTGDVALAVDMSSSTATRTVARLTFSGVLTECGSLTDGLYQLTFLAGQASGFGQPLDGDANGAAGGDFVLDLHRLFGDSDGDRDVDLSDLIRFGSAYNNPGAYRSDFDSDGDGDIDLSDLIMFAVRYYVAFP